MMSEEDSQVPIWSYRVNLDKWVRSDHPLRRIRAALDLSFLRKAVAHTNGQKGIKSVPPEVIIRMMLLRFLDDIKSERELMRIAIDADGINRLERFQTRRRWIAGRLPLYREGVGRTKT